MIPLMWFYNTVIVFQCSNIIYFQGSPARAQQARTELRRTGERVG